MAPQVSRVRRHRPPLRRELVETHPAPVSCRRGQVQGTCVWERVPRDRLTARPGPRPCTAASRTEDRRSLLPKVSPRCWCPRPGRLPGLTLQPLHPAQSLRAPTGGSCVDEGPGSMGEIERCPRPAGWAERASCHREPVPTSGTVWPHMWLSCVLIKPRLSSLWLLILNDNCSFRWLSGQRPLHPIFKQRSHDGRERDI